MLGGRPVEFFPELGERPVFLCLLLRRLLFRLACGQGFFPLCAKARCSVAGACRFPKLGQRQTGLVQRHALRGPAQGFFLPFAVLLIADDEIEVRLDAVLACGMLPYPDAFFQLAPLIAHSYAPKSCPHFVPTFCVKQRGNKGR